MVFSVLPQFGVNAPSIWAFAAGVLAFVLVVWLVFMGVQFIKGLVNNA